MLDWQSSGVSLMQNALKLKDEVHGSSSVHALGPNPDIREMRTEDWKVNPVS